MPKNMTHGKKPKRRTSAARAAASRNNGRRSSGPRTADGKQRAAAAGLRHSLRHGLRSPRAFLPGQNFGLYSALARKLLDDLQPANAEEFALARRLADALWMWLRWLTVQLGLGSWLDEDPDAVLDTRDAREDANFTLPPMPSPETLRRYESRVRRRWGEDFHRFLTLRASRLYPAAPAGPDPDADALDASFSIGYRIDFDPDDPKTDRRATIPPPGELSGLLDAFAYRFTWLLAYQMGDHLPDPLRRTLEPDFARLPEFRPDPDEGPLALVPSLLIRSLIAGLGLDGTPDPAPARASGSLVRAVTPPPSSQILNLKSETPSSGSLVHHEPPPQSAIRNPKSEMPPWGSLVQPPPPAQSPAESSGSLVRAVTPPPSSQFSNLKSEIRNPQSAIPSSGSLVQPVSPPTRFLRTAQRWLVRPYRFLIRVHP